MEPMQSRYWNHCRWVTRRSRCDSALASASESAVESVLEPALALASD